MAAFAELEAEVFAGLFADGISLLAELCQGVEVRRVLDIGCGPGVGTCYLAEGFPSASVVAVDGSATMLERVTARAAGLDLSQRVSTHRAELPAGLAALGRADVAWASMVLHHVGDEVDALRRIRELLEPGGVLAVVERAQPLRVVLDGDLGRPGIWERLDAASGTWFDDMRAELPHATTSADYASMIVDAGFALLADRVLNVVLDAPLDAAAQRFAHGHLQRTRTLLEGYAEPDDLGALDALLDGGFLQRADVRLCASRQLYIAAPSCASLAQ